MLNVVESEGGVRNGIGKGGKETARAKSQTDGNFDGCRCMEQQRVVQVCKVSNILAEILFNATMT